MLRLIAPIKVAIYCTNSLNLIGLITRVHNYIYKLIGTIQININRIICVTKYISIKLNQ